MSIFKARNQLFYNNLYDYILYHNSFIFDLLLFPRYRGKDNLITRIITIYVPTKPTVWRDRKVYFQQQNALTIDNITECPLKVFWKDLWELVDTCKKDEEQIILMRDWNQDVWEESS